MCGIVGAVAQREVKDILLEGLKRLEYRGYDSAGVAFLHDSNLLRLRVVGKVEQLARALEQATEITGNIGVAHTRWATHGKPCEQNAHPQMSTQEVAVVHNGIIENHDELRLALTEQGYEFTSGTDTEVVVHLIHSYLQKGNALLQAVSLAAKHLKGAYALGVTASAAPNQLVAVRHGSPLVIGCGFGENFFASDALALLPVTQRFIDLQDGDVATVTGEAVTIYDKDGSEVQRTEYTLNASMQQDAERGPYRHFMQKEMFEQPEAVHNTLAPMLSETSLLESEFGPEVQALLAKTKQVHIIACGTSYHAGAVARYWLESMAGLPCNVEIASEYRYRKPVVQDGTLFVVVSQSGETADTLAALREARQREGYVGVLAICNVAASVMVREADGVILTHAGREIGVASTKAFTTQLSAFMLLTLALAKQAGLDAATEQDIVTALHDLPSYLEQALALDEPIRHLAHSFADKEHTLFLGRGTQYPIALEGALKLKEISYIHAEAYAAGELKHGPLALIDKNMPVVVVAPSDELLEKLKANLHEVRARGGQLIVFAEAGSGVVEEDGITVLNMPSLPQCVAPMVYTIPLQLLAYHVALIKGTDVDQPRNLAKSVTVE